MTEQNDAKSITTFSDNSSYATLISQQSESIRRKIRDDGTSTRNDGTSSRNDGTSSRNDGTSTTISGFSDFFYLNNTNNRSNIMDQESNPSSSSRRHSNSITITLPPSSSNLLAPPPYNLDPPSYATVLRPGETRISDSSIDEEWGHIIQLLGPSAPFIAPKPPPTYNQAQGLQSEQVSEEIVDIPDSNSNLFRFAGVSVICPVCTNLVQTETQQVVTKATHITAVVLFLLGCWPCFLMPYCLPYFKTTLHFCPVCGHFFGLYSPLFTRYF